jgi:hypothetical protein
MGEAGSSYGEFQTALRNGSFELALDLARSLPRISLADALRLTLLAARKEPTRYPEMARRWLVRVLVEQRPSLDELAWASALLSIAGKGNAQDEKVVEVLGGLL